MKKLNSIYDLNLDEELRPFLDSYKVESLFEEYEAYLATQNHLNKMHNSHLIPKVQYDRLDSVYRKFYMYSGHNFMEVFAKTMLSNDQVIFDKVYEVMNDGHMFNIVKPKDKTKAYDEETQFIDLKLVLENIARFIKENSPPPKPVDKLRA